MVIFTENPAGIGRIWPYSLKTRQGLDGYGHFRRKLAEDWTNMAIFTQNLPGIGRIWPYLSKTRRGWNEYSHICRKPGGCGINIATAFSSPAGLGEVKCVFSTYLSRTGDKKAGRILSLMGMGFVRLVCSTNWVNF